MITIALHDLRFHGFHGCYEEEKIVGNDFEVSLDVAFDETVPIIKDLNESIDYTSLFDLVRNRMKKPTHLLETIAMEIASEIKVKYHWVREINISVKKINPPIFDFQGSTSVTYHKKYNG